MSEVIATQEEIDHENLRKFHSIFEKRGGFLLAST